MGLLMQDQRSLKKLTNLYKIFKFGVYQGNDEQDTAIQNSKSNLPRISIIDLQKRCPEIHWSILVWQTQNLGIF